MTPREHERRIKALEKALAEEQEASLEDLIHLSLGNPPPSRLRSTPGHEPTVVELIRATTERIEPKEGSGSV